ncbi:MAG: hypothetical protein OEN02_16110 [Gammaproteobacteria bacterium]|nr:hypothetical protein [Gammaproteobacteria bacterium]
MDRVIIVIQYSLLGQLLKVSALAQPVWRKNENTDSKLIHSGFLSHETDIHLMLAIAGEDI